MAIFDSTLGVFNGYTISPSTQDNVQRTQTKLVVREGQVPPEKWLIDPRLKPLFKYMNVPGYVVIPKGRIVALSVDGGPNNDGRFEGYMSRNLFNALTIANGGVDVDEVGKDGQVYIRKANRPLGVAPYNLYEQKPDDGADLVPTIIRSDTYIEVPYLSSKEAAEAVQWGCAYGGLVGGDYVMSDANGRFIKWNEYKVKSQVFDDVTPDGSGNAVVYVDYPIKPGTEPMVAAVLASDGTTVVDTASLDDVKYAAGLVTLSGLGTSNVQVTITYVSVVPEGYEQIVGKVCAVDTNMPPEGWLKWAEWSMDDRMTMTDYIDDLGLRPQDVDSDPRTARGLFDGGYPYSRKMRDAVWGTVPGQGIPGLTNGSNIEVTYTDEKIGEIQAGVAADTIHHFYLKHKPAVEGSAVIKINSVEVTPEYVDYPTGLVIVKNPSQYSDKVDVTASYRATGQIPGVPTNWDFKGSVGAVRIMLLA